MLRESFNNYGIIKEYNNNNITIKYYADGIKGAKKDDILILSEVLWLLDCSIEGDEFCLSNYETGCSIYNCFSDKWYIFPFSYLEKLENGKTIKLYAYDPFDGFKVKGKTYKEKKENARRLAVDFRAYFAESIFSYGELGYFADIFRKIGKKYGLLKEFEENGLI